MSKLGLDRRTVLAAGASGVFYLAAGRAAGQPRIRIERFSPELDRVIDVNAPIRKLADIPSVPNGPVGPPEGPVWFAEGNYLLFTHMESVSVMRYTPGAGLRVERKGVSYASITRDRQGRLLACERDPNRVVRFEPDGSATVVANKYQGRRISRPNDVVVASDGAIYFTGPLTRGTIPEEWEVQVPGVFRVSPDLGVVSLVTDTLSPNGLAFSHDEKRLYVIGERQIVSFEMSTRNPGLASPTGRKVFFQFAGDEPGGPDGMKVDILGNVYSGGPGGLWIISPAGVALGRVIHGESSTINVAFGGPDWRTLFFTTRNTLGSVDLKVSGVPVPARKFP